MTNDRQASAVRRWTMLALALTVMGGAAWPGCGSDEVTGDGASSDNDDDGQGGSGNAGGGDPTGGGGGDNPCPGATLCNGSCTNTAFDPQNCGACGVACGQGELCSNSLCGVTCGGGSTECEGLCINTQTDHDNCGACGAPCGDGEVCSGGICALECFGGTTECGGVCVNTSNDPAHCGGCDVPCDTGEVCSAGQCGLNCSGGTSECSGLCVNLDSDNGNCGNCGVACQNGEVCSAGQCGLMCVGGTTLCNNACVETQTDPVNCGTCGNVCPANEVCSAGVCASLCGGGLTKCGNNCVDTQTDEANCGSCGNACPGGADCTAGACVQCNSSTTDCDADGWLVSEGDCCDKPGLCGAEPIKVNPGAIEVEGNGIDDNCNNKVDLFDTEDTVACDSGLSSSSSVANDYVKALGLCRTTTEAPALKKDKTWGVISSAILRADGSALGDVRARSIRTGFGSVNPQSTDGSSIVVLSTGIAADGTQTNPGPNGGAPGGFNVSTTHTPSSSVSISSCASADCIDDWFATPNPPLKNANELPDSPGCNASTSSTANDSVMLKLRMRAPTNSRAFSFNSYFLSAEYPEYVCTTFNDQFIALVDTPSGTPTPFANPIDKNLLTYTQNNQKWPIGINVAQGTDLFKVCETQAQNAGCWDTSVSAISCSQGIGELAGTGFQKPTSATCIIGGGTDWLTTAGTVIPGEIVELRIVLWDVGDTAFDSSALLDGFTWLSNATLPGTQ